MTRRTVAHIVFAHLALFAFAGSLTAAELDGRFSSQWYFWEDTVDTHLRPYQRLELDYVPYRRSMDNATVSVHSSARWTTDLADKFADDPELFVYDAYLKVDKFIPNTDLRAGRQFVYTSAGSGLIDGGRIRVKPVRQLTIDVFGGAWVERTDPENIQSLSDDGFYGGRIGVYPIRGTRVGFNWILRNQAGDLARHLVGVDFQQRLRPFVFYGKGLYNAIDRRLASVLGRASYADKGWYVGVEYYFREPFVNSNSLFSIIDFNRYNEIRIDAQRRLLPTLSLFGSLDFDVFEEDDAVRATIGVSSRWYSIGYRHKSGYGGENDGVFGQVTWRATSDWEFYAVANLQRYRVQDEQVDRNDAYSGQLGARWEIGRGFDAEIQGQLLRNAVQESDARLYLRLSKDFSFKSGEASR